LLHPVGRSVKIFHAQEYKKYFSEAAEVELFLAPDNMVFPYSTQLMQTFLDFLPLFNAVVLTILGLKVAGARQQARRLEVAIGNTKASISE
jgi:hypothetical protein